MEKAVALLCVLGLGMCFSLLGSISVKLMPRLGIDQGKFGSLISAFMASCLVASLLMGVVTDKFGYKPVAIFGFVLASVCVRQFESPLPGFLLIDREEAVDEGPQNIPQLLTCPSVLRAKPEPGPRGQESLSPGDFFLNRTAGSRHFIKRGETTGPNGPPRMLRRSASCTSQVHRSPSRTTVGTRRPCECCGRSGSCTDQKCTDCLRQRQRAWDG
jgi:hypothetical protein